ncbi:hypothetical protein [Trueperella abortisuis]|uniref:Uncharacterized protein n=1 Tax=Trueperella abortisuis TaxID=445930 RepID=A0ABT9PH90_9ACTO|nr:hypothetical protein [Trueperella abortisuis]MDP9832075.1 hypothetical protein [Trueperella abortisuis]
MRHSLDELAGMIDALLELVPETQYAREMRQQAEYEEVVWALQDEAKRRGIELPERLKEKV